MKKIISISALVLLIAIFFYSRIDKENASNKNLTKEIEVSTDIKQSNLDRNRQAKEIRVPATGRSIASIKTEPFTRNGKIIMGENVAMFTSNDTELKMSNRYNKGWEKLLTKRLSRFQNERSEIKIDKELSYIEIKNHMGRHVEIAKISVIKDGLKRSFRAKVDAGNGMILSTWDQTRFEN